FLARCDPHDVDDTYRRCDLQTRVSRDDATSLPSGSASSLFLPPNGSVRPDVDERDGSRRDDERWPRRGDVTRRQRRIVENGRGDGNSRDAVRLDPDRAWDVGAIHEEHADRAAGVATGEDGAEPAVEPAILVPDRRQARRAAA